MKLAAMAALGVIAMHSVHLTLGSQIASRALAREEEQLGQALARMIAEHAADPLLVNDLVALDAIASSAVSEAQRGVTYCFIVRDGDVVARSFEGATAPALVGLRPSGDHAPVVVVSPDSTRTLDLSAPIPGGVGEVRLGLDMSAQAETREELQRELGLLALLMIGAGLAAALIVGRSLARPIHALLRSAEQFDLAHAEDLPSVSPRGTDEIAVLGDRFNQMLVRLKAVYREQQRVQQKNMETERMVALGSLVAGVTHEVNNPLAGLRNCVHRLSRPDLPPNKRREYLELMEEGLTRIEKVVQGLLDFSRPHPPALEATQLSELAGAAASLIAPQLARREIAVRVLETGPRRNVLVDRHQIGQALVNLLLNAAYVTKVGGEVRLRLVERDLQQGLSVEDDGPGIPPEIRDRVLDPFFTTKPPGEGTGLGLSVTRTIIAAHGGELTFSFPPKGGTVATLWVNAAPDP
ncbi:MAG: HAMP domain-containing histidine kinase [Deltaproteobacteria bacterium]|nr:HAMP domain-containing histidine kinase [Deltaproteobacteria bacterium]